jgi:hypothetical protein
MECAKCGNSMSLCICDDCDERIADLEKSPYLAMNWDALKAMRLLNKFEIERLKKEAKDGQ